MSNKCPNIDLGGIGKGRKYVTVNICQPCDIIHDLNKFPYPFHNSSVEEIIMSQILIHLREPLEVMREIYRICKDKALVRIRVPYWKDVMFSDPWVFNVFRPKWFRKLCNLDMPESGTGRKEQSGYWIPFRFMLIDMHHNRGIFRFWKRYSLNVVLEVVK